MASDRNDNYQIVTDQIILALENVQSGKWEKPWKTGARPTSVSTGKPYRGINNILLKMQQLFGGYEFPLWLTFEQAKKLGGSVKKGEKSTTVVFWKFIKTSKEDASGEKKEHTFPMLRTFRVFNLDQCQNLDRDKIVAKFIEENSHREFNPIERCEEFVKNTNATITYQDIDMACYVPGLDIISMPLRGSFKSEDGFYATLLHELGHWTMHKDRCDRSSNSDYAFEELVAEFTSAFVSSELGLETGLQHPAYIASWLTKLRNDNKMAMKAAQQAQKAADYLWSLQGNSVDSEDGEEDENDCA